MIYENVELTGSLNISGSLVVPAGGDGDRENITGSVFFNTGSNRFEIFTGVSGSEWDNIFSGTGSGGSGGGDTPASTEVEYLVVAGGGGGGAASGGGGGGGGAGGYLSSSFASLTSGSTYTITVGSGGTGATTSANAGGDGGDSSISGTDITTVTATAGGGGSGYLADGGDGGSGGGGSGNLLPGNTGQVGNAGTSGQGNDGGDGGGDGQTGGGGGGGASAAGGDGDSSNNGGDGGDGLQSSITGTSTYYAGGGGGGRDSRTAANDGAGGSGGGGTGGVGGSAGTTNTGGGGGGSAYQESTYPGRNGGSGVVILAYDSGSIHGAGGIKGDAGNGRRYHQFNSSDSFVVGSTSDFNIVTDNLIVHFDAGDFASRGTSTWTDLSENSNDGTVSGATLGANWYYDFDGSNDHVDITATNTSPLNFTNEVFSLEAWVNIDVFGIVEGIISRWNPSGAYQFRLNLGNTSPYTFFEYVERTTSSTNARFASSTTISANTWYHLAVTRSDTQVTMYIDGTQDFQSSATNVIRSETSAPLRIGHVNDGSLRFDGQIAQVRIYDKTLSASEVLQNYNATKTNFV